MSIRPSCWTGRRPTMSATEVVRVLRWARNCSTTIGDVVEEHDPRSAPELMAGDILTHGDGGRLSAHRLDETASIKASGTLEASHHHARRS